MDFETALTRLLAHEGGYVAHAADRGGETNMGISKRSYPLEDIRNLTRARAAEIYARDFWGPAGCDCVPDPIKYHLFDAAVHHGVRGAVRLLQGVVGETQDGILGPRTLQAVQSMPAPRLASRFIGARLDLMAGLTSWPAFGRGWARRLAANLKEV